MTSQVRVIIHNYQYPNLKKHFIKIVATRCFTCEAYQKTQHLIQIEAISYLNCRQRGRVVTAPD